MQTPKKRIGSSDASHKVSPRIVRQLRQSGSESADSSSSSNHVRVSKDRSPKVSERRSPRSPVIEKNRNGKSSEMEAQISRLRDEVKTAKEQLALSESSKKQAEEAAEEMKLKLSSIVSKMEELQKQQAVEEEENPLEQKTDDGYQRFSVDSSELCTALGEIQLLKSQVKAAADSEEAANNLANSAKAELRIMKEKFGDTVSLIETLKIQLIESKQSEFLAQSMADDAISQLEAKALGEEEESEVRLVEQMSKVEQGASEPENFEFQKSDEVKIQAGKREAELEDILRKTKAMVDALKADLMDKETELQGISEENEGLASKLERSLSSQRAKEAEMETDLRMLQEINADLQSDSLLKDAELRKLHDENEMLKDRLERRNQEETKQKIEVAAELEEARAREREAVTKLELIMEEAEKSNNKVVRVTEQLEAAQAASSEMEAELRKLKVQSDQWRKAAEAAATMLSSGANNGKFAERTASLDGQYSPVGGNISPFNDEDDDLRKRNGSVLKKIGVLWKKPLK